MISPFEGKLALITLLGAAWLAAYNRAGRIDLQKQYHVACIERDLRKAQFCLRSMWIGLAAAFVSLLSLDALSGTTFDSNSEQSWVLGLARAAGVWGLMVAAVVWSQVARRAIGPETDRRIPISSSDERRNR